MCGFAGFVGFGDEDVLGRMTRSLRHRGPDGEGFYVDETARVFLGHRRLSVVDLAGGAQPMWDAEKTVGVIFNGEIYNHADLRADLIAGGAVFQSDHSDTEVLVHGYKKWGTGLVEKLNGMFSFVIYDVRKKSLFGARDRFGEKPFYLARQDGFLGFASEVSALTLHPKVGRKVNLSMLKKYFAYGYLPAPHSFYQGCEKLPAGHFFTYDIGTGRLDVRSYWQFSIDPDVSYHKKRDDDVVDELRFLLRQAVSRRLMSDVKLGIFLSGGVDSSAILLHAAQLRDAEDLESFCIGFDEPSFDESPYAKQMADYVGCRHHEKILSVDDLQQLIPDVLGQLDEPLADVSLLPTSMLSAFAREHVTVALSGDGGDELFAGYDPFKAIGMARLYDAMVPKLLHKNIRRLADMLPVSHDNISFDFKIKRTLTGLSHPWSMRLPVWMGMLDPACLESVLMDRVDVEEIYGDAIGVWQASKSKNTHDRAMEFYTRFYLQDDILMKTDRASMMHSLESRAVFLDNDLVNFCQKLPTHFKYRNGVRKYILKKSLSGMMPPHLLNRKKKGFGVPVGQWLRDGALDEYFPAMVPPGFHGIEVKRLLAEHRRGEKDHRLFLWAYLVAAYKMQG